MTMYHLKQEQCIMCGLCQCKAPHLIDYNNQGIVCWKKTEQAFYQPQTKEEEAQCHKACLHCPVQAIQQQKN